MPSEFREVLSRAVYNFKEPNYLANMAKFNLIVFRKFPVDLTLKVDNATVGCYSDGITVQAFVEHLANALK